MAKFLRNIKRAGLSSKRFLSVVDFFETNLFKKELGFKNIGSNVHSPSVYVPTEQVIYSETFGNNGLNGFGFPHYNAPTGWTMSNIPVEFYGDQDVINFCNVSGSSGGVMLAFGNGTGGDTTYVITNAISTIGKTNIKLNFNEYRGYTGAGLPPNLTLEYSPDNGTNWNTISWTETTTQLTWVNSGDISLPVGAENKAQLKIKISMFEDGTGELTAIDDFKVKATY